MKTTVEIAQEISFFYHQSPRDYVVSRGVEPTATDQPPWTTYGYRQALLKLDGLDVMEFIQRVIDTKGRAKVLDAGCGSGRFLSECKQGYRRHRDGLLVPGWRDKIECFGLTARLYSFSWMSGDQGVRIDVGDAQNLARFYHGQSFDVITAVHVAHHVADPWALVYGMYERLGDGGGCFIRGIPFNLVDEEEAALANYLRENYAAEVKDPYFDRRFPERLADISLKKADRELLLPLEYADVREAKFAPRVFYRFNPTVAFQPVFT